jgi:NADH-quinone oxidoreductase subunit H
MKIISNLSFTITYFFMYISEICSICTQSILFLHLDKYLIFLIKIICILISVAYFTIAERKIMASIQRRRGPNVEGGFFGLLQPLADGLKLFIKEIIIPNHANIIVYFLAPILVFTLSLSGWFLIPFNLQKIETNILSVPLEIINNYFIMELNTKNTAILVFNNQFGVLILLALSSLNVYGIILSGWASNSKYAFLGSLRSAAQMISYEVSIGLTILPVVILTQSFNLLEIVLLQKKTIWFCFPLLPCTTIFLISILAETNRAPFDLPEAEAELVAGYNVEYSGMLFALFFLGEYSSMLLMAALSIILFFGGWDIPLINDISNNLNFINLFFFALKISLFCFFYIIVRATFPRYRYDQLMNIGWKIFLPIALSMVIYTGISFKIFLNEVCIDSHTGLLLAGVHNINKTRDNCRSISKAIFEEEISETLYKYLNNFPITIDWFLGYSLEIIQIACLQNYIITTIKNNKNKKDETLKKNL